MVVVVVVLGSEVPVTGAWWPSSCSRRMVAAPS